MWERRETALRKEITRVEDLLVPELTYLCRCAGISCEHVAVQLLFWGKTALVVIGEREPGAAYLGNRCCTTRWCGKCRGEHLFG